MRAVAHWIIALFASPAGIVLLGALDSTLFFTLPFGIDAAVIALASRGGALVWAAPLLATSGSIGGAFLTFWMGRKLGEAGLERLVPSKRLARVRKRIGESGAKALAVLDLIPPPFPFTVFVLAAGAFEVSSWTFFVTLAICRLLRFGGEALLALFYGQRILAWLQSDLVESIVGVLIILAVVVSVVSVIRLLKRGRPAASSRPSRRRRVAGPA